MNNFVNMHAVKIVCVVAAVIMFEHFAYGGGKYIVCFLESGRISKWLYLGGWYR